MAAARRIMAQACASHWWRLVGFDESGRTSSRRSSGSSSDLARRHDVGVYVLRYHREPGQQLRGATHLRPWATVTDCWAQYGLWLLLFANTGQPDVLHGYWALPVGLVAALAGRRLGVPSVVTCDSGEFVSIPRATYGLQ